MNETSVISFAKMKGTIEIVNYSLKCVAAVLYVIQIVDIRYSLQMLGVPIKGSFWMLCERQIITMVYLCWNKDAFLQMCRYHGDHDHYQGL